MWPSSTMSWWRATQSLTSESMVAMDCVLMLPHAECQRRPAHHAVAFGKRCLEPVVVANHGVWVELPVGRIDKDDVDVSVRVGGHLQYTVHRNVQRFVKLRERAHVVDGKF